MTVRGDLGEKKLEEEPQRPFAKNLTSAGADWHFRCNCGSSHHSEEELGAISHPRSRS